MLISNLPRRRLLAILVAVTVLQASIEMLAQGRQDEEREPDNQRELELKACGPKDAKHSVRTDEKNHPTPEVGADTALLYVVRPTGMGGRIQSKLAVDGQWVGVNRGKNYFYVTLAPGEHYLCSQAENRSVIVMNVEAGRTYYVQQKITMGFMKARNRLVVLEEMEGQRHVAEAHLSVSEAKP